MSESLFSRVKKKVEGNPELGMGILISIPIFLFILLAWINDNFMILDQSYWIGVISFNCVIFYGIYFAYSRKRIEVSTKIFYYGIGLSLLILFLFQNIAFSGDITVGVIDGARLLWEGQNPYVVEGVRHAIPDIPGEFRLTTYAYLPVDLLTYSLFLGLLSFISAIFMEMEVFFPIRFMLDLLLTTFVRSFKPILEMIDIFNILPELNTTGIVSFLPGFNGMGILLTNLFFMAISSILIYKILECKKQEALLLGLVFFTIMIWNNVCLAQTLFFAGWYFHKKEIGSLTLLFWSLSMLSKYFAGIFIVGYFIQYFHKKEYFTAIKLSLIPILLTFIFLLPFGIIETLKSTVFFYNTEQRILDGSFGGSIFSEIILMFGLEDFTWLFTLIGFTLILIIILQLKDLYERLVIGSLTSLLVLSGMSAQFFPMILFILILSNSVCIFDYQKGITEGEATKIHHEVGQSSSRFSRLREEAVARFLKRIADDQ
ncbi:hypothetical protein [Candidatus Hodarchaeum mangrovi]